MQYWGNCNEHLGMSENVSKRGDLFNRRKWRKIWSFQLYRQTTFIRFSQTAYICTKVRLQGPQIRQPEENVLSHSSPSKRSLKIALNTDLCHETWWHCSTFCTYQSSKLFNRFLDPSYPRSYLTEYLTKSYYGVFTWKLLKIKRNHELFP